MSYGEPPPPPSENPYGGPPNYAQQPPGGYGGQPPYGAPGGYGQPAGTNKKAIWSLVLGIVGLVCCGFFTGVPAIILSRMAKSEIAVRNESGGGLATAGFVLGIIAVVWGVISIILLATGTLTLEA